MLPAAAVIAGIETGSSPEQQGFKPPPLGGLFCLPKSRHALAHLILISVDFQLSAGLKCDH